MKKNVFIVAMLCSTLAVNSQTEINSAKKIRVGFNLGTNYSILRSKESLPTNSKIYNDFGYKIGVLMDYSISRQLFFTPKAEFAFNNSGIESTNNDNTMSKYKIFPASIDIMTHFAYEFGSGNSRPYLLIGPNFRFPIKTITNSSSEFRNSSDIAIDFGIGFRSGLKYFSLCPELRYSMGLLNVNKNPSYQTLKYHNISLVLNFK